MSALHAASRRRAFTLVRAAALATIATAAPSPAAAQRGAPTLEQLLGDPFPSELVSAPTGGAVAWVFDTRGARDIWTAAPPSWKAHAVTRYRADDGQELTNLAFTRDGKSIVYVRGGEPNGKGEIPNPALIPGGVERAIWLVAAAGDAPPRRITEGYDPAVSPRGDTVAYLFHDQIWITALDSGATPAQLLHTRGRLTTLRWSPDGSRLAFVSRRRDHGFVGVYDFAARTLRYLAPSVDNDVAPAWSPDSRRIAFIRIPARTRQEIFGARREGEPWSIWVADAATGEGHEIWRAHPGVGSVFRGVDADAQLHWGAGDRIVFPWEGDGWTHLYSVRAAGRAGRAGGAGDAGSAATLLTPGEFEVEHVSLASDGASVLYSSNQGDIDRRHLWRVGVDGGAPVQLTRGEGIEWRPVAASDGSAVVFLRSDARRPARPGILPRGGTARDLAPEAIPADFPSAALVVPRQVIFPAADGLGLHGQLFLPANAKPGERHPAVVFFHGGSRRQMLLGWHYMYYYHNAYALNQYLASRGYVVLSVNYRSGIGYGMKFREALDYGATGGSEYNDVQGAGLYLRSRADVDPARIGVWGGSYGGYMTALALARSSDLFAAGVDLHGVHDWNLEWDTLVPGWDMEREQRARELAFRSSPMADVSGWRSPVLLIQGDDDRNVNFSQTVQLTEDLRKQGVDVEQLIFPDEVHDFLTYDHWLRAYEAAVSFFDRKLLGAGAARPEVGGQGPGARE
ncbi:MAG TPA: prolyl oligopeptidase family serine peptidase [Gemmatimonadaceae bacterium]